MFDEEDKNKKLKAVDLLTAMQQEELTEKQLAADLKLILDDYFVGKAVLDGKRIEFTLLNGQKFFITVDKESRKLFKCKRNKIR